MMLGFIATLVIAVITGWAGDALVKDNMPGGFWGAMLAGLVGAWIGAYAPLFNTLGPKILDIAIVPAVIGAAIFITVLGFFRNTARQFR
jgi:uncharacterized membrane protein YeaQ/YmgE (transglycosylase-associated protein family)